MNKRKLVASAILISMSLFSSLAMAQNKMAFRQPLSGVEGNPSFGMTTAELTSMCSTQTVTVTQEERTRIAYKDEPTGNSTEILRDFINYQETVKISDEFSAKSFYSFKERFASEIRFVIDLTYKGDYLYKNILVPTTNPVLRMGNYEITLWEHQYTNGTFAHYSLIFSELEVERTPYEEIYYVDVESKSKNYDWCVANGYPTGN